MTTLNVEKIYKDNNAMLEGHFLLSSGKHSGFYLQSAKVLETPSKAALLANALAQTIRESGLKFDSICSPALGGIIAGYELARTLDVRFIFTERVQGVMQLRRGFGVQKGERFLVCEDIITTGGSALESAQILTQLGAEVVAFAALANRGICKRVGSNLPAKPEAKLPSDIPFFALADFAFEIYLPDSCPLCKAGGVAIKPGSRGN